MQPLTTSFESETVLAELAEGTPKRIACRPTACSDVILYTRPLLSLEES